MPLNGALARRGEESVKAQLFAAHNGGGILNFLESEVGRTFVALTERAEDHKVVGASPRIVRAGENRRDSGVGTAEGNGMRHEVRRTGALFMRGAGGTVLARGGCEIVRGVPAEKVSGVPQEGVLPHVDPREPAATGEEGTGEARLGQRTRVGQAGTAGLTAFRLCNLVAQSSERPALRVHF